MPKLSVVMPVYNAEDTLAEAVDSVLSQSLDDLELICVDDGSTDGSLEILRGYEERDPRVRVLTQENQHAGPARNKGLEAARGEYVHFLDADDHVLPYAYECLYDKAAKHDLDVLRCAAVSWDVGRGCFVELERNSLSKLDPGDFNRLVGTEVGSPIYKTAVAPWAGLFRREFLLERDIRFNDLACVNDRSFFAAAATNARRMMVCRDRVVFHRYAQADSLVGGRAKHFDCQFRSIELVVARLEADDIERDVAERVLAGEFDDLFHWFVLLSDGSGTGDAVEARTAAFVEGYKGPFDYLLGNKYRAALKRLPRRKERGIAPDRKVDVRHEPCEHPKVSVVVPVYNVEDYLNEALHSLTCQTLKEMEFVCVDDGSTDGSAAILNEYAALDGRIRILGGPNGGYGRAVNRGIDAARGEYLGILEPDDFASREMYASLYRAARENDVDLVKADFYRFRMGEGGTVRRVPTKVLPSASGYNRVLTPRDELPVFERTINIWSGIYRLEFLKRWHIRCNETPGASCQDNGLWFQIFCRAERALYLDEPFYMYRRDNPNASMASRGKLYCITEEYAFIERWLKQEPGLWDEFRSLFYWKKFSGFMVTYRRIAPELELEYLRHTRDEFAGPLEEGLIDEELFGEAWMWRLREIVADPDAYFERIRVSVIMPVYNGERYLSQALDSVLARNDVQIEVICVDDGSTDATPAILAEYAARDPRVRVLTQVNAGAGAARNAGMELARGEYLSFLDADDLFAPDMLGMAYSRAHLADADIVVFRCDEYHEETGEYVPTPGSIKDSLLPATQPFAGSEIEQNVYRAFVGWTWDKLFRANFVRREGLRFQEQRTTNDALFTFSAIVRAERICTMDNVLVHRRMHEGSLSATREESWRCFYDALLAMRQQLRDWGLYEERERDFVNYSLHFSLWNLNTVSGPAYRELYRALTGGWLEELGVTAHDEDYFYNKDEYAQLQELLASSAEEYQFHLLDRARAGRDSSQRALRAAKDELKDQRARTRKLEARNRKLGAQNRKLSAANEELKARNKKLKAEAEHQSSEVRALRSSNSWRIGRAVTWLPRKIKALIKQIGGGA